MLFEGHNVDIVILNTISIAFNDDEIYNRVTENFLSNETNPSHKGNHVIPVKNITDNTDWSQDYGIFSTTSQGSNFSRANPFDRHTHPKTKAGIIIAVSIVAGLILVIFIGTTALMYMWYKRKRIELLKEVHIGDLESSEDSVNWQIQFNDVDIDYENLIGKGSTSKVYRAMLKTIAPLHKVLTTSATSRFSNCPVAVKIPIDNSYEEIVINSKELEAYKVLKYHDNILSCLGWVQVDSRKCLVFDLAIGGDLRKCVMAMRGLPDEEFNEKEFLFIFKEICLGMAYMASCGMSKSATSACAATATRASPTRRPYPSFYLSVGSPLEALVDRVFSEKSDVWSFGVLMYEVFSKGVTPYMALSNAEIVEFLSSGQRLEPTALASEEISLVMLSCWNADVTLRPTFEELVRTFEQTLEKRSEHYGYLMA
ncbi:hypothetical protein L596_010654 [Steinernema carpocapsae]|uniref:Protein kinase domain-containing protein n=1 Tax=Steinernema carpocapsae TaxID=34508 RepID=A0A4U5PJ45_STECR|nr:hypothetical protein L596_010654 [Steinernema carpocapsae]